MKKFKTKQACLRRQGFTLLEILLVVAALAILAGIVILALNPGRQLGQTKDAQRSVDVNTILNAVYQYALDNNGNLPPTIPAAADVAEICATGGTCTGVDLSVLTDNGTYLTAIPKDPTGSDADTAGYRISTTTTGRVTVDAPDVEQSASISVTR